MPTVAQLKAQLAAKGLPTDGVKAVLEASGPTLLRLKPAFCSRATIATKMKAFAS